MSPQIYCGKISERAKRALERRLRPHTTLSAHELAYTLRISESTIWSILRGSKSGPSGHVLQLLGRHSCTRFSAAPTFIASIRATATGQRHCG